MKKIQVDIFSEAINCPVIKLETRRFPGVLIQGDSLSNIYSIIDELKSYQEKDTEPFDLADEAMGILKNYLCEYEGVLKVHNVDLPFSGSALPDQAD